jgi:HAMP domain-containing protein
MAVVGLFAYQTSASLLQEISIRQLNALAESKRADLVKVQEGWRNQLRLIRSQTQLRRSLQSYLNTDDKDALQRVRQIIEDVATAVDDVDRITVFNLEGDELVAFGRAPRHKTVLPQETDEIVYTGTFLEESGAIRVGFTGFLVEDGSPIAVIEIIFASDDVASVTSNYTGLGETGEAIVVMIAEDKVTILNPLRHYTERPIVELSVEDASRPIRLLVSGGEGPLLESFQDYRGVDSWAATRIIAELDWGLIVKVDAEEEESRADQLRGALLDIALALSAFAIVGGTLLGFYLARPIHELRLVVERVRAGEMDARAEVAGDDEIAYLANSLNELIDTWQPKSQDD